MIHYGKALGDSGKQKLPFKWKKPPAEPGLGRDTVIGGKGRWTGKKRHCGRESDINKNWTYNQINPYTKVGRAWCA